MNKFILALVMCVFAIPAQTAEIKVIANKIDVTQSIKGLPLKNKEARKSDNGRNKVVWEIAGADHGGLEIIGNKSTDADVLAWSCAMYDKQGMSISPSDPKHLCHRLLVQVLSNFVTEPQKLALWLTQVPKGVAGTAIYQLPPFHIESDNLFFAVRRR